MQGSYTFSRVKFKHFKNFQAFPAPYSCSKLLSNQLGLSDLFYFFI